MKKLKLALAVLLTCVAGFTYADQLEENLSKYDEGFKAHKAGDYKTAVELWRPLAEQGVADAQFNLGVAYHAGQGVPQNTQEAIKWYRKAAELGNAKAQLNVGIL